jgi:hypothetical protein
MRAQVFRILKYLSFTIFIFALFHASKGVSAQEAGPVQIIEGRLDAAGGSVYLIPDLATGDTITVYAEGTGGNLDPIIAISEAGIDGKALRESLRSRVTNAVNAGQDPLIALDEVLDGLFLAWDDDGGEGYDSALSYDIVQDGDYLLILSSNLTSDTFGDYRLTVGIDAPEVLSGNAVGTGEIIAFRDQTASQERIGVQEFKGNLSEGNFDTFYDLSEFVAGDTVYAYVEGTGADLAPVLTLRDFGRKPVRISNYLGEDDFAALSFTFDDQASNYQLAIEACCEDGERSEGDYRLLVGLNSPEVLEGSGVPSGRKVIHQSIDVKIGLKLQQITGVDQKSENFGIVASLVMEWQEPGLVFSPDECQCAFKVFFGDDFSTFAVENDVQWPEFTLFNQQGRRFTQNQVVVLWPDGRATYFERFTATLQAPDFNFRKFPFDSQEFFIRIDSLFPEEFYTFVDLEGFSELGSQLGEEEWTVTNYETEITSEVASTTRLGSRFSFGFEAQRQISFYVIRILIPILIILVVSWVTFFLKDYGKRVDVAAGNLLLFIAFNFTISGDLPKLGYLTFLDTILIGTFVITALVVIFNVILKRLEAAGKGDLAHSLDRYTIWIYPLAYAAATVIVVFLFS